MPQQDVNLIKSILQETMVFAQSKERKNRTSKIKKWTRIEVGRLLFCLWQIYENKLEIAESSGIPSKQKLNNSSINKIEAASHGSAKHPFYKCLQELFNNYDFPESKSDSNWADSNLENRKKDIIYSKLQKQRSAIQKLEEVMTEMAKLIKSKGSQ